MNRFFPNRKMLGNYFNFIGNYKKVLVSSCHYSLKSSPKKSPIPKLFAGFVVGLAGLYLIEHRYGKKPIKEQNQDSEPTLSFDLNEIYEKTAVVFLSNEKVNIQLKFNLRCIF
jgi:hypothetical protein